MERVKSWRDLVVADIGAGTGFHVARFAEKAKHAIAVEPIGNLRLAIMQRVIKKGAGNVSVIAGSAELTGLADHSVDVVQARFAYFFGAGCEPGLREIERVIRPTGRFLSSTTTGVMANSRSGYGLRRLRSVSIPTPSTSSG